MKFKFALNVLTVALMGVLGASAYAQSVVPVKGSASVDQLKLDVKGKAAPTTNQAAQEAKLSPASAPSSASSASNLFSAPTASTKSTSPSATTSGTTSASTSEGLSGVPFDANPNATETANTLASVSDLQAELSLQKLSLEVDKQIQARKDFANGISHTGGVAGGTQSKTQQQEATPPPAKPKVTSVYSFGNRSFAEITMGDGSKYVVSPGSHLPNGMRVGRVHDGGVDLIEGRHSSFYPVTAGVATYRGSTNANPSSAVQPTAMPSTMISPAAPPVALPPMPSH